MWDVGEDDSIENYRKVESMNLNDPVRVAFEWKPGKRPRGRPRKKWIDVVAKDLN